MQCEVEQMCRGYITLKCSSFLDLTNSQRIFNADIMMMNVSLKAMTFTSAISKLYALSLARLSVHTINGSNYREA